ncbi:hypothetical protein GCM10011390_19760 [Aureimonas endophytica]|uniref:Uncharacterized protein n=1 Tax=Aureimonas endophytica TaxID=2027858 RepID=A0A916ZJH4_9HYPH|nr:hypothetical protein GCM10011390_19760 [Aureimonas endophytica]
MARMHYQGWDHSHRTSHMIMAQEHTASGDRLTGSVIRIAAVAFCATFWVGVAMWLL